MIVLDTNVVSEPLRSQPDPAVLEWFASIGDEVATTSITIGELLTGVRLLPAGRRRGGLLAAIDETLRQFADRVLGYGEPEARTYAELQERRRAMGRPLSVEDGMIAAVCRCRGGRLATRNVIDFTGLDVELVNPWNLDAG